MVEEHDFSIITGSEGCRTDYSLSEFTDYLNADLSSKKLEYGWVFWRPEIYHQSEYDDLNHDFNSSSHQKEVKDKIISVLEATTSEREGWIWYRSLIQFWAAKVKGRHHYLSTSDQPFCLRPLSKGFCWYRKLCMDQYYVVEEGAEQEQLGPIQRVFHSKHAESSPDLRLYSTNEFPLRDHAARCGLRSYLAFPVFDLLKNECYGVVEVLSSGVTNMRNLFLSFDRGLQAGGLRSTHTSFFPMSHYDAESIVNVLPFKYKQQPESEISRMLELAIMVVPELHFAQVWIPCKQCTNMSNNLSCLERAIFITAECKSLNLYKYTDSVFEYLQACELHNLQIGKGIAKAIMSSNSKSYFCRNLCDISIFENPLTHYAQNARLSLYLAIALESVHNSNDLYVIEFFLGSNSRKEACNDSAQNLLIKIMENELKSYKVALGGQLIGKELLVELGKPNAVQYESSEYAKEIKHQHSEESNMFMLMERYWESYSESNFQTYLQTADLCFLRPSKKDECGWVFGSQSREELFDINSNSSLVPDPIKNKIKLFMNQIASKFLPGSYRLVQFWAPKMGQGRCYLATLDQPYALSCLQKGLAFFRKQCMKHHYFMDDGAKEEELGPPGRVFRNGHPEMTPDLRFYSIREFSLKNHAVQCRLQRYSALPVFDIDQYKCVGVLELLEFRGCVSDGDIEEALEGANLSSTHFRFQRCFEAIHIAKHRELALMEVKEALKLIGNIPQLYKAEVRVPYDNSNLSCMQLVLSTECEVEYMDMYHIHVQTGKGIVGMALASEDKSCFCRNSCDFTITEQPRAHHEQQERLDVCFAICLQSSHTGNLLYVLEFFLNQGPATYEYLLSFLKFLLPIMKQELTSFKLASGKQLGDQLVVEVIEFSEENRLTFSELDQTEIFPIRFKIVQYGQKEHHHGNDQQMQYVSDSIDSIRSSAAKNPKKEHAAKKTEEGKGKTSLHLNLVDLEPHFGRRLDDVAEELGVGRSTIKRVLRKINITRWPNNKKYKKNPSLFMKESASSEIARAFQQNMHPSGSGNVPLLQNMPQTNTESTQHLIVGEEAKEVIIKVKYENYTIKFQLNLSSGIEKLVEEVARRLNLKKGSFKLKYVDEDDDEILIACDDDLKLCAKTLTAAGKTFIQLFV